MKKQIAAFAITGVAFAAMAQYAIDWSTMDGGGQTMTGGSYAVRGTLGQPDADEANGGDFVVRGAFWVPQAVQMEGAPWLAIARTGVDEVTVSWSPDDPGWCLQETFSLTTNWVDCISGTTNPIIIPVAEAAMFYRLHRE